MAKRLAQDPRLIRLTKISLALPETARQCHEQHAAFLVRKRTFAYYLSDHHGDGIVAVQPDRFYLPAYIGPRGWVALRLDVGHVDWDEVAELVLGSYRLIAPKRLAELVKAGT